MSHKNNTEKRQLKPKLSSLNGSIRKFSLSGVRSSNNNPWEAEKHRKSKTLEGIRYF